MKHSFLLSALTAIVIFAATTTAEAGIFGRLSVVWNGCNPCEPVACTPCEPIACNPCEPIACNPCEPLCDPCAVVCGPRPLFRPFGGFFMNLKAKLAASHHCAPGCDPCEPVACNPCEPIACNPCEPICDPCAVVGSPRPLFRPFGGLFANMKMKSATPCCAAGACNPCEAICDPCTACRW